MVAVNYDWDELEDNIDEEYDDGGSTIAEYTTEPALFGNVISQRRSGQSSFLHCDGLGSTLALTNTVGTVTDTNAYSAFGEMTEQTGSTVNPFQYVGQKGYYKYDATGEYLVRQRLFNSGIARWLSPDLIVAGISGLTSFAYCHNNPVMFVDASGAFEVTVNEAFRWKTDFCGAYMIDLIYKATPTTFSYPLVVVQQIRIVLDLSYCDCDRAKGDKPDVCSKVVCKEAYSKCVFFEYVTVYRDKPEQRIDEKAAADMITSRPHSIPGKCPNTQGKESFVHEMRVFEDPTGTLESEVNGWKGGVECFGAPIGTNKASKSCSFWDTGKIVDRGGHEGFVSWNCCSPTGRYQVFRIVTKDEKARSGEKVLAYKRILAGEGEGVTPREIERRKGKCDHIILGDPPPTAP